MLLSFQDKRTETIFKTGQAHKLDKALAKKAAKQLDRLDAVERIEDLYFPPSNRFHRLKGFNPTRYGIAINKQWRITFVWNGDDVENALFEDYH